MLTMSGNGATPPEPRRMPGIEVKVDDPVLGYNRIWFTRHALTRMKQRGITESEVFAVLKTPTQKGLPTAPRRLRWRKHRTARLAVDVVFTRLPNQLRIITVIKAAI